MERYDVWLAILCFSVLAFAATGSLSIDPLEREEREVADSHEHWEHMVRRSVANWGEHRKHYPVVEEPEIVNVQEYYRQVLDNDWPEAKEEEYYYHVLHRPQKGKNGKFASTQGGHHRDQQKAIPGRYIVMFSAGTSDYHLDRTIAILRHANYESHRNRWDLRATDFTPFRHIGKGFTATLSSNIVRILWKSPIVFTIEQDVALKRNNHYSAGQVHTTEQNVLWNLDRLDQHTNVLDGVYHPEADGKGVEIYIFDTGIRYSHHDFEGRAVYGGYDAIDAMTGSERSGADCNGHGTHCAGTAAGKKYGVAKKASLKSIRVLGCSGTGAVSGILHGMDYVVQKKSSARKVISMSLGVRNNLQFNTAVNNVAGKGIIVVAASGNQAKDSCHISPGSATGSISVAATDISDMSASFSNIGRCVDVFAPGMSITSAGMYCNKCTAVKSGTSMACPHVAGYAAILLGIDSSLSPAAVKARIVKHATKNVVSLVSMNAHLAPVTPNRLLYVPQAGSVEEDL